MPSYTWGRRKLCDWLDEMGAVDEFAAQAATYVAAAPLDLWAHCYLGDARARQGDAAAARVAFERSAELGPSSYAISRAFDLAAAAEDRPGMKALMERALASLPRLDGLSLRARYAAATEDEALGVAALDGLIDLAPPHGRLEPVIEALAGASFGDHILRRLEERFVSDDAVEPALGWIWSTVRRRVWPAGALRILDRRDHLNRAGRAAVAGWIEVLATEGRWWTLLWLWLRHRRWLALGTTTWGAVGFALVVRGWHGLCRRWMSDWRTRLDATPAALFNACAAAWNAGDVAEAQAIGASALARAPDHTRLMYEALDAVHQALAGPLEAGRSVLARLNPSEPIVRGASALVEALAAAEALRSSGEPLSATALVERVWPMLTSVEDAGRRSPVIADVAAEVGRRMTLVLPPRERAAFTAVLRDSGIFRA